MENPLDMMRQVAAEAYADAADRGDLLTIQAISLDEPNHAAVVTRDGGIGTRVFLDVTQLVNASLETMMDEIEQTYGSVAAMPDEAKTYYTGYRDAIMATMTGGLAIALAYDTQNLDPADFS